MNISALLAEMALQLHGASTSQETLDQVAKYACTAVEGDESGVMLVGPKGEVSTPAGTSPLMATAHNLQRDLDEGPCLEAMRDGEKSYNVADTRRDERWPQWGPACADLGFLSTVSVRLEVGDRRYGSLNVYGRRRQAFDDEDRQVIDILASHASVALASTRTNEEMRIALDSRTLIGQAQGILMNFYDIDAESAFSYLRRLSQDHNVKLVEVARDLVKNRGSLRPTND